MHCGAFRGHCIIVQWIGGRLCFPILDIESGTSSYQILRNHPMTKQIKSCTVLRFSAVKKREEKSGLEFFHFITGSWVEVRLTGLRCGRRVIPDDSSFRSRSEFYSLQKSKIMLKNETATASSKAESTVYVAASSSTAAHEIGSDPYNFKGKLLATLLSFSVFQSYPLLYNA